MPGGASPNIVVVVTTIFPGSDLLPVLLVTTVLLPPSSDCDCSHNLLEQEYVLEPTADDSL